jgi:hypothetical protein
MATEKTKLISKEVHLKALALFTMANSHYTKAKAFEIEMAEVLGAGDEYGYCGALSDEIYESNPSFERGLKNEGFAVQPAKEKPR